MVHSRLLPRTFVRRKAQWWLVKLRGDPSADLQTKFSRWYAADPRNAQAFELERQRFGTYGILRASELAADRPLAAPESGPKLRYALAAVLALALLIPASFLIFDDGGRLGSPAHATRYTSDVGELRNIPLGDGSSITLDSESVVVVAIDRGRRRAELERGRARFAIHPASDPFVVRAGAVQLRSRAATVDVQKDGSRSEVEVRAGSAEVKGADNGPAVLSAGQGAETAPGNALNLYHVKDHGRWTSGMLEFDETSLGAAVALVNRYSTKRVILGDPQLATLRVTGVFRAGDLSGFARSVARAFALQLEQSAGGDLLLSRRRPADAQKKKGG